MEVKDIIENLSPRERSEVNSNNIDSIQKLIPLLLKRVTPENVEPLASLLRKSVLPSICLDVDDKIEHLFIKIEANPQLLFKEEVQGKIEDFILKRFEADKKLVIEQTSDISKFVTLMGQYLNDAISSSGNGSKNVLSIKEKIQSIDLNANGLKELEQLQTELVSAAGSIEDEMDTVSDKLKSGKSKVQELEEKVKTLEEELTKSKSESMKDHLTGLLTRRAYDEEVKRIESHYKRSNTQYAVVFFDLDYFKKINDTYGHDCGDVILSTFAKILDKNTRDEDIVGRYGGEEFVAIVHFNLTRELLQYLKRIKTIVTSNSFLYKGNKIKVTFSAGVSIRPNHDSYENTIQKADMLLYEAKENGRDQIKLEDGRTIK
ncbi:GGDEF domain-containing protein [Poseidonibacter lekithochrous]|uniref:GGDEF domain-containing protein n=1 Tax=Poseidonibacter lekithochrous TaxID=1904463 RepID=UPI0008FC6112|nr:GGDEF domain-containing protein [Poseidonibacter lekithochrous]QKJ23622.1 diguanylate cyclase [Poseidonibacter lekithochrous]